MLPRDQSIHTRYVLQKTRYTLANLVAGAIYYYVAGTLQVILTTPDILFPSVFDKEPKITPLQIF